MPTLPHSVWLNVARYLPALLLRDLYAVNHSFFEIAMDCRYRQLIFAYMDLRMVKNLVRLRDPAVAKRVQILHVYPGFLPDPNGAPSLFDQGKPECPVQKRSFLTLLLDIANTFLEQRNSLSRHPKYRMMEALRKPEDVVQILADVLAGLPNVTDYYVTWHGLPAIASSPAPFVVSPLRPNLRKLSLNLSLENVQSLLSPDSDISRLEEFHLCIHSESVYDEHERSYVLQNHLAPAISRFQSTLKTLVISSWEPTDLSPLFQNIDCIPNLDDLSINIPVESCHLGDPAGLNAFLQKHQNSLRCLRLRASQYGGQGIIPASLTSLYDWICKATDSVELPKLRVLDTASSLFPIEASLLCVQRFSGTLTSLSITGVYQSYDCVAETLTHLSNSPAGEEPLKLRLGPVLLSPQLVDLIAARIPNLHQLELLVRKIVPIDADAASSPTNNSKSSKSKQIDGFIFAMESRRYPTWRLHQLSLVTDILPDRDHYEAALGKAFFGSIPSLHCFT
ncbi:hypothetical protein D9611_012715 [Ephemerocybe angulata]|uniref:F-box domain-containing protein n=1 Tax=Ephemerocybe angulata TaxID=980116 RepID=A0A8H5F0D5_9AGAR|nr:hypothetical protein D9611_012715 [Tulosesus angulatus]